MNSTKSAAKNSNNTDDLDPIVAVALANAIADKQLKPLKDSIEDGANVGFEFTAKISGRLTRGASTEAAATCSLLNEATVCELIRRLGVQRELFEKHLRDICEEAILKDVPIKDLLIEKDPQLLTTIEVVKTAIVRKLPKQQRRGAVKVVAGVQIVRQKVG